MIESVVERDGSRLSVPEILEKLKVCSSSRDLHCGRRIHARLVQHGEESSVTVANTLIDMYCKCGRSRDALWIFETMEHHTVVSWTALIHGFTQGGQGEIGLEFFLEMQQEGCHPNRVTFIAALKACAAIASGDGSTRKNREVSLRQGRQIHEQAVASGVEMESDPLLANTVLDMYGKCGDLIEARKVFGKVVRHGSVVSWSCMILGYVENEEPVLALELFQRMQEDGVAPNRVTFLAAIKACANLSTREEGKQIQGRFVKINSLERIRDFHSRAAKALLVLDTALLNSLVDAYGKCGAVAEAREAFDSLSRPTVVSWTAIIHSYAHGSSGDSLLALEMFSRMQDVGCAPNRATFLAALKACGSLAALDTGRKIEAQIHSARLQNDPLLATSLVDFYGKCGSMKDAQRVFDSTSSRDLVAWDALIAGYSWQGQSDRVLDLFEKMTGDARLRPDAVTFLSVLNACIHAGAVEKGADYFYSMLPKFGIAPSIKHYTCMVDLLGRANRVDEAVAMVLRMPFEPDLRIWMAVLRACKDVENGELAFQSILGLDSGNMAAYSMMSNIYAAAGMHAESSRLIQAIRSAPNNLEQAGGLIP